MVWTGPPDVEIFVYSWKQRWLIPTLHVTPGPAIQGRPWTVLDRAPSGAFVRHVTGVLERGNPRSDFEGWEDNEEWESELTTVSGARRYRDFERGSRLFCLRWFRRHRATVEEFGPDGGTKWEAEVPPRTSLVSVATAFAAALESAMDASPSSAGEAASAAALGALRGPAPTHAPKKRAPKKPAPAKPASPRRR